MKGTVVLCVISPRLRLECPVGEEKITGLGDDAADSSGRVVSDDAHSVLGVLNDEFAVVKLQEELALNRCPENL